MRPLGQKALGRIGGVPLVGVATTLGAGGDKNASPDHKLRRDEVDSTLGVLSRAQCLGPNTTPR